MSQWTLACGNSHPAAAGDSVCIRGSRCTRCRTVTIAASRAWAFNTLRKLSWMVHVLLVGLCRATLGYTGPLSVEQSVAMQLCPTAAPTLWGVSPRACLYSSGLTGSAYRACGEAASALRAMALLQVHQTKALKDLHKGSHDLAVLHELRAATDLALRATKVTAQSLGRAMSTLVVQERHF